MLHADPLMLDIDVNHWRNLQSILLDSAKGRRRIVVIHEDGEVLKLAHSQRLPVVGTVERVEDPHAVAEMLYRDNAAIADFVAVFERNAFNQYFGRSQATWSPDEDLDEFVHRMYEMIDDYPDGIVTYPGPARHVLGLQWRLGASHSQVTNAVKTLVPPASTVLLGIFEGDDLWATLVLGFDEQLRARVVTTVDMSAVTVQPGREAMAKEAVAWVNRCYPPCAIALFTSLAGARAFLAAQDKGASLRQLAAEGDLIADPVPPGWRGPN